MTRMTPTTLRLVLIVSCAHAMVHMFEHALPAVEQLIADDFGVSKERTGELGTVWRLPFGLCAMFAGWLADRFGPKLLLIVYLLGCCTTAALAWWAPSLGMLFGVMFAMGCFASIYHPAGLSLISHETTLANRGAALGWHGIFGSVGIAAAPFLASLVFSTGLVGWRGFYLVLTVPALLIAVLMTQLRIHSERYAPPTAEDGAEPPPEEPIPWRSFLMLVTVGALSGFVYAAFLQFLPRYLDQTGLRPSGWSAASFRNALTAIVLLCAAVGQGVAGRIARHGKLEKQLVFVVFGNVPFLLWMATAEGGWRFVAACCLAFVHFMNQPLYNSLIAQLIPRSRRSTSYGFSNMVCFGIGAFGPMTAGHIGSLRMVYAFLGGIAAVAGGMAVVFWRTHAGAEQVEE